MTRRREAPRIPAALLVAQLKTAINCACDARGDTPANRAALILECCALDAAGQADMRDHFEREAIAWSRASPDASPNTASSHPQRVQRDRRGASNTGLLTPPAVKLTASNAGTMEPAMSPNNASQNDDRDEFAKIEETPDVRQAARALIVAADRLHRAIADASPQAGRDLLATLALAGATGSTTVRQISAGHFEIYAGWMDDSTARGLETFKADFKRADVAPWFQ